MASTENNIIVKYKYPNFDDKKLQKKIALKKEFKYPYSIPKKGIVSLDKEDSLCQQEEFTLSPHQEFIKNFIHPNTPYNGLLLYHGMGTGKTCTAIGVTEQFRNIHKYNADFKKIWIISSANVQDNFRLQLFDEDKLIQKNGIWNLDSCVGPNLLQELQDYDLQNMTREMIAKKINKNIKKHYNFLGYEKFANLILNIVRNVKVSDEKRYKKIVKEKLNETFGNCLLVIDEAHNVRINGGEGDKKIAKSIQLLTTHVKKNKILLLTGTPMYNDSREIIFLLNILRSNDGLSAIKTSEIFDKNGELLISKEGEKLGELNLSIKSNGYVSFVRGENPYIFPFKVYPRDYESPSSVFNFEYPKIQYNGVAINRGIQFLDLYLSQMSDFQRQGYQYFTQKLHKSPEMKKEAKNDNEEAAISGYKEFQEAIYTLNICYPGDKDGEYLNGKNGLFSVVAKDQNSKYSYINKDNNIFDYGNIGKYSAKIKEILKLIIESTGIVLIYSQYKDAGLIPIALALEELGMNRLSANDNLFSSSGRRKSGNNVFEGKYSMITGDPIHSKNNSKEIKVINKEENKNGELCKVVLITQAGSEGIDFKNLRQVHILEPWYNLNRMDQIVGRAIRNCSHKALPLEKRNCQIFMHGSYIDEKEEMIDLLLYRRCEDKARKIGTVQKVLKSVSVDCLVHENQKEFSNLTETLEQIEISTKNQKIANFDVKDKPYSLVCDYQENCNYKCKNKLMSKTDKEDKSTYSYLHTVKNQLIERIKKLFLKKHVYKFEEILSILNEMDPEKTYSALTHLVNNKAETISDKFGKKGHVMNVKNLYVFQPQEFDDSYTSLYDKMRPLKQKPLKIDVTKEAPKQIENKSLLIDKSMGVNTSVMNNSSAVSSNRLLEKMKSQFETGMAIKGELKDKSKDFYENYSLVIEKLKELIPNIDINIRKKRNWLIEHLIETVPFKKELSLVNYLFQQNIETKKEKFVFLVKQYYENNFIFDFLDGKILFLVDLADKNAEIGDKSNLFDSNIKLYYKPNSEAKFRKITQSEKQDGRDMIIKILKQIKMDNNKVSKYLVFTGHYEKDKVNPSQLKIKRVGEMHKSKKNKGRVFKNEIPKDMYPVLNDIIGEKVIAPKIFIKEQLAVVLEIISKMFTTKDSIIYINKLQHAENNVKEL
jgi:hypothetical protein